jgi:2-succinyl-5-enolpyruvyl-6-hydroxy-3-cyclohexene-1-carboxylate synthase
VAGPTEEASRLGRAVVELAAALGWPILADPLSGARYGPSAGAHLVAGYDLFLRDETVRERLAPDFILRVGASPTSSALQGWLQHHDGVRHIVLDDTQRWKDHGATATHYLRVDPADALAGLASRIASHSEDEAWSALWRSADDATRGVLAGLAPAAAEEQHEGRILAALAETLPAEAGLVVSSSMPIRDLDGYGLPREGELHVFANRGASGIDGVVSTAFGVASQRHEPTACVIGDVAFFHDQNGLLWSRETDAAVVFILIDNDGGGIFHMLPIADHDPHFTQYFATPHGIDPRHAAEAHGLDFIEATEETFRTVVDEALTTGRTTVVRVRTDRSANHRLHVETRADVVRSVIEALA